MKYCNFFPLNIRQDLSYRPAVASTYPRASYITVTAPKGRLCGPWSRPLLSLIHKPQVLVSRVTFALVLWWWTCHHPILHSQRSKTAAVFLIYSTLRNKTAFCEMTLKILNRQNLVTRHRTIASLTSVFQPWGGPSLLPPFMCEAAAASQPSENFEDTCPE